MHIRTKLVEAFDALAQNGSANRSAPTLASVETINAALGMRLPESLLDFAARSRSFDSWFASLGEDYTSPNHILVINRRLHKIRRRVPGAHGRWEFAAPRHFIALNRGFDSDFDCFDTSAPPETGGEFPIQYWSTPRIFGEVQQPDFPTYLEAMVRSWAEGSRKTGLTLDF
jgi:hypothetical protein